MKGIMAILSQACSSADISYNVRNVLHLVSRYRTCRPICKSTNSAWSPTCLIQGEEECASSIVQSEIIKPAHMTSRIVSAMDQQPPLYIQMQS